MPAIITRLDNLDELTADIAAMAQRHVGYGVKPHHYDQVGKALLWTLQQGLGTKWTPETGAAWAACYTTLVEIMEQATG